MSSLRLHYSFCEEKHIIRDDDIECYTMDGRKAAADVTCSTKSGLICRSSKTKPTCPDHVVRFW